MTQKFDIIGDIHGHYSILVRLLEKLGYRKTIEGSYAHCNRKAIFIGDFINRGPEIAKTIRLIRNMVEQKHALAILGNHEFNAILYFTKKKDSNKCFLKHIPRHQMQLVKTIEAFHEYPAELKSHVKWLRELPLFLDFGTIRFAHASWIDEHISLIGTAFSNSKLKKSQLQNYFDNSFLNEAVNLTLRGVDFELPNSLILRDNKGMSHRKFRAKWWETKKPITFREICLSHAFEMPKLTIPQEIDYKSYPYSDDAPPLFLGHFCLKKGAEIFQNNICIIDSCVTRSKILSAYRWDGEQKLLSDKIVSVK